MPESVARSFSILEQAEAWKKFQAICRAQGRFNDPKIGEFRYDVVSDKNGAINKIDNRKLAKLAKLCGAPHASGAGILFNAPLYKKVSKSDLLFTLFAQSKGELEYAKEYYRLNSDVILYIA